MQVKLALFGVHAVCKFVNEVKLNKVERSFFLAISDEKKLNLKKKFAKHLVKKIGSNSSKHSSIFKDKTNKFIVHNLNIFYSRITKKLRKITKNVNQNNEKVPKTLSLHITVEKNKLWKKIVILCSTLGELSNDTTHNHLRWTCLLAETD